MLNAFHNCISNNALWVNIQGKLFLQTEQMDRFQSAIRFEFQRNQGRQDSSSQSSLLGAPAPNLGNATHPGY